MPLIERGQAAGVFRSDLPIAWHLAVILAIVHAARRRAAERPHPEAEVEAAMLTTVAAAIGAAR